MQHRRRFRGLSLLALALAFAVPDLAAAQAQEPCARTIKAKVVALDQPWVWNRLGAAQPHGMIFALRRDVVDKTTLLTEEEGGELNEGNVMLRRDKRPRPLVLRMNVGDCIEIDFQNLLDDQPGNNQPHTRTAAVHAIGMQLVHSILDDGSNVGAIPNPGSLLSPGQRRTYTWYAEREGNHVLYSTAANVGGEGDGGQLNNGLFGMVNVEPRGSVWYRSQVTAEELEWSRACVTVPGDPCNTPDGHPILDYDAKYPNTHRYAGRPILSILEGNEIFHSDLNAIVASIPDNTYPQVRYVYPDREQSFREFTVLYHDEIGAVQAFREFDDGDENEEEGLEHTLHSVRDAFAINYGSAGIGAEILANRLGVGPMWDCTDCRYEEFFLSSWAVSDPAMVVDVPANTPGPGGPDPLPGPKATEAFFPEDPSNVHHAYLWDHVKFRIGHGGSKEHHVHHQHTHQWLFTPDSDRSSYLDSQTLGPGSAFTLEMVYNGSGNKNLSVGDSIFHCHFYPHFAQGMWALWRVHDVFENGRRRLPDGEIPDGTPIPAVVPIPDRPMAPMPQANVAIIPTDHDGDGDFDSGQVSVTPLVPGDPLGNPGYPFFVPGQAGHRPPSPPLDTVHDGGLPRHVVVSHPNNASVEVHTEFDFTKELVRLHARELSEFGSPVELAAMAFHELRKHDTYLPDGTPATGAKGFTTNGQCRIAGAPYAEPCVDIDGNIVGQPPVHFEAADIQIDAIFNKVGWHYPQTRITSLRHDVAAYFAGTRAPEPMFLRVHSGKCIEYELTNLVPDFYEFDDFQVRTPTDVLGQHIHLVKFDVLASDGAANGWNYEDGSLSAGEVRARLRALRDFDPGPKSGLLLIGGTYAPDSALVAEVNPDYAFLDESEFIGAQTTIQRWMADELLDNAGVDRTLKTVFTHDHFGPSTHQQAGLYAGLIVEHKGTVWVDPVDNSNLAGRASWRAIIDFPLQPDRSYREFLLEFADFQLAYRKDSHPELPYGGGPVFPLPWNVANPRMPGDGFDRLPFAINPPGKKEVGLPDLLQPPDRTMPEAVSADDVGTMTVNYRNEPVALRIVDFSADPPQQAAGLPGDLSHVFRSDLTRAVGELNLPPSSWPYSTPAGPPPGSASVGAKEGDPFTPLMNAFEHDRVQVKILVGAHEEGHNFTLQGHRWLFEPDWKDSGWRNSQVMAISEHFEMVTKVDHIASLPFVDYLYEVGASTDDLWNGLWGLLRAHKTASPDFGTFKELSSNANKKGPTFDNVSSFVGPCPVGAPVQSYRLRAVRAKDVLPNGTLVYNDRIGGTPNTTGPLHDPTAILYVPDGDLAIVPGPIGYTASLIPKTEPLILHANAGDCIQIELVNHLRGHALDLDGFATLPMLIVDFNANDVRPSNDVGLHAQLVDYLVSTSDGTNVGFNPIQTAPPQPIAPWGMLDPSRIVKYTWYAGERVVEPWGSRVAVPMELGAANLMSSDRIEHASKGAFGGLVIEPEGSTWSPVPGRRAHTVVNLPGGGFFRDFVLLFQSDVNLRRPNGGPLLPLDETDDPEDSGNKAANYRTEPMWFRMDFPPELPLDDKRQKDFTKSLNDAQVGGPPKTPVFVAAPFDPIRFRLLKPGGNQRNHVFALHGHVWEMLPYTHDSADPYEARLGSTRIGKNGLSMWEGSTMGIGPSSHHNLVPVHGAGGQFGIPGDFLWRDMQSFMFDGGLWGLLKVTPISSGGAVE